MGRLAQWKHDHTEDRRQVDAISLEENEENLVEVGTHRNGKYPFKDRIVR